MWACTMTAQLAQNMPILAGFAMCKRRLVEQNIAAMLPLRESSSLTPHLRKYLLECNPQPAGPGCKLRPPCAKSQLRFAESRASPSTTRASPIDASRSSNQVRLGNVCLVRLPASRKRSAPSRYPTSHNGTSMAVHINGAAGLEVSSNKWLLQGNINFFYVGIPYTPASFFEKTL